MKNSILTQALKVSMESEQSTDAVIDEMVSEQLANGGVSPAQIVEGVDQIDGELDVLDAVENSISGEEVSLENLAHARGMLDAIGFRYGAITEHVSMESAHDTRLDKDAIVSDLNGYRNGLEQHAMVSMEGIFLVGSNIKDIGTDLSSMKKTIAALKSGDTEKVRDIKLGVLKHFLKIGGALPQDIPRAIKDVANGLELSIKHANDVLTSSQRAAEIAVKVDWTDPDAAAKGRDQIKALKLDLAKITSDLNGFPMFGNRAFGVKVRGSAGELGEWNKKYSFGAGTPNMGIMHTVMLVVGAIGALTINPIGGVLVMILSSVPGESKRELPLKSFGAALDDYSKVAEKIYNQRSNMLTKNNIHGKLTSDLKNAKGLPKDVRNAIVRASSFGWSISNGVYDVVKHSVHALATASITAVYS